MKKLNIRILPVFAAVAFTVLGLTACSGSNNSSSSGAGGGPGNGHNIGGMPGSPIMSTGQQIPVGQQVHIHDSGQYPVVVQGGATMDLECTGHVEYSYRHDGQVDNGICANQSITIPIAGSGTMQFNLGQGADMGLQLHI